MSAERTTPSRTVSIGLSAAESAELLIASITDYAIYVLDPVGHVATWNPGAERIKGYAVSEIVGRHFSIFYTAEDRDAGIPEQELLAAAEGRHEAEGWRVRKDGTQFWASVVITPVRDASGTFLGYAKVTRDLTERHRAEEQHLSMQRAQEAMKIRDDFIVDAKRALDRARATIQIHLNSLTATIGGLDDHAAVTIKAKATTLEWSLDRIVRSMDLVVALADEASRRLSGSPK